MKPTKYPTITKAEAKALIVSKTIRQAYLYEPDHCPRDQFLWVDFGLSVGKILYRRVKP